MPAEWCKETNIWFVNYNSTVLDGSIISIGANTQIGPAVAHDLLTRLGGYSEEQIERICWLVAHHHTYHVCEDIDYQILIEADFLVNLYEDNETPKAIEVVRRNIFRTKSGLKMFNNMFGTKE